jgi:hypothetical protein
VASFDAGDEGERLRRYQTTNHREMLRTVESISKVRLLKVKLEKEEAGVILRNEPNSRANEVHLEPAAAEAEDADREIGVPGESSASREEDRTSPILRNEPNFDLDGVEWVEIPGFDEARETIRRSGPRHDLIVPVGSGGESGRPGHAISSGFETSTTSSPRALARSA